MKNNFFSFREINSHTVILEQVDPISAMKKDNPCNVSFYCHKQIQHIENW